MIKGYQHFWLIFLSCIVGAGLWLITGFMVSIGCFAPYCPLEVLAHDHALNAKIMAEWDTVVMYRVLLVWGLVGAIFSPAMWFVYVNKPSWQHREPPRLLAQDFETRPGPKTRAEQTTILQAMFFAALIQMALAYFILPNFQTQLVVVKSAGVRVGLGAAMGLCAAIIPTLNAKLFRWMFNTRIG